VHVKIIEIGETEESVSVSLDVNTPCLSLYTHVHVLWISTTHRENHRD
jgi:hypothetical protein